MPCTMIVDVSCPYMLIVLGFLTSAQIASEIWGEIGGIHHLTSPFR